jgi:hypothetical protein
MTVDRRARGPATVVTALIILMVAGVAVTAAVAGPARSARLFTSRVDLEQRLGAFAARLTVGRPYRDPSPEERGRAVGALLSLVHVAGGPPGSDDASAVAVFERFGFSHSDEVDPATGRRFLMVASRPDDERSWGVIVIDRSAPIHLVVEVPHPNSDLRTELVGAQVFRAVPGAVLLMAGAHRRAGGAAADVAHNDRSMFSGWAAALAGRGLPQLQLHGFADQSLPDRDAVVSSGTAPPSLSARRVADSLTDAGLAVCRPWQGRCGQLEGSINVQAREAERLRTVFIHVELNARVRAAARLRAATVAALAEARIDPA